MLNLRRNRRIPSRHRRLGSNHLLLLRLGSNHLVLFDGRNGGKLLCE